MSLKCSDTYKLFALHKVWIVLNVIHNTNCSNQRKNHNQCCFITLTFLLHFAQNSSWWVRKWKCKILISFGAVGYLLSLDIQGPKADLQVRKKNSIQKWRSGCQKENFQNHLAILSNAVLQIIKMCLRARGGTAREEYCRCGQGYP